MKAKWVPNGKSPEVEISIGTTYLDTDTNTLFKWDGKDWVKHEPAKEVSLNHCKDCKWFRYYPDEGYFSSIKPPWGHCENSIIQFGQFITKSAKLKFYPSEGKGGVCLIHEDFGCVGWEGKE